MHGAGLSAYHSGAIMLFPVALISFVLNKKVVFRYGKTN
jgi:hypothetical protein